MSQDKPGTIERFRRSLEGAASYAEVWETVRGSVEYAMHRHRTGMMLFLDDLPIQLGAYHPLGTNNIVLNRVLVQIVEGAIENKAVINALVYNLLVHEYIHALGEVSEANVRQTVIDVTKKCFGEDHIVTQIALKSPWSLLKGIPLVGVNPQKRVMEIVKDFEKAGRYVV